MIHHFDSIAEVYNKVWHLSDGYKSWMLQHILEKLSLQENDILADIGGGTGSYTRLLLEHSPLKKAYCVEPSEKMCEQAAGIEGIEAYCMGALEFAREPLTFNKVLCKEMIHHIKERREFFTLLYTTLHPKGKIVIVTRPRHTTLPLFNAAKQAFFNNQPPSEYFETELYDAGFSVETCTDTYTFELDKHNWFEMIRHRFMSDLGHFSHEEIEKGITEIDAALQSDTITVKDTLIFLTATKS